MGDVAVREADPRRRQQGHEEEPARIRCFQGPLGRELGRGLPVPQWRRRRWRRRRWLLVRFRPGRLGTGETSPELETESATLSRKSGKCWKIMNCLLIVCYTYNGGGRIPILCNIYITTNVCMNYSSRRRINITKNYLLKKREPKEKRQDKSR